MFLPLALRNFEMGKGSFKRRIFWGTSVHAESDSFRAVRQMTDTHLLKEFPVRRTFDTVIGFPTAQTIPHGFDESRNIRRSPIGITVVGNDAS